MLGKRKRDTAVISRGKEVQKSEPEAPRNNEALDILRRHFESEFEPLEPNNPRREVSEEVVSDTPSLDEEEENNSDWEGISEEGSEQEAEVVEHLDSYNASKDVTDKQARKAFMTSKPPSSSSAPNTTKHKPTSKEDTDDQSLDADNLKNDLALQRLLKESHLLDSASDLAPSGKKRLRALDLRMQDAGAKSSLFEQKKMPMSHRKGINAKAAKKEEARRREARENGIILEKPTLPKGKGSKGKRERGVGGPAVGKFAGGTLRLSKKDISTIQGPKKNPRGKGKGKAKSRR